MTKVDVLDQVAADLSRGRTHLAIQRLSSLVAVHPTDLDLRRRLAAAHRAAGNRVQAGRWGYLDPDADQIEQVAFERRYPDPLIRLRQLRWPLSSELAATEFARVRLAGLGTGSPVTPAARASRRSRRVLSTAAVVVVGLIAAVLAIVGAITIAGWLAS